MSSPLDPHITLVLPQHIDAREANLLLAVASCRESRTRVHAQLPDGASSWQSDGSRSDHLCSSRATVFLGLCQVQGRQLSGDAECQRQGTCTKGVLEASD